MIRATFSGTEARLSLPSSWAQLEEHELLAMYKAMAASPLDDVRLIGLRVLAGIRFDHRRDSGGEVFYSMPVKHSDGKVRRMVFYLKPEVIGSIMSELDWMREPGTEPVRLPRLGRHAAVDARLRNLPFGDYLLVENLYQGFVQSRNAAALAKAARILYPGYRGGKFGRVQVINMLNWLLQVKALFSARFPNFFKPAVDDGGESSIEDIYNNQIRALTGGDITKEEQVKSIDCWRALTELDFKAREAEELRQEQAKYRNK